MKYVIIILLFSIFLIPSNSYAQDFHISIEPTVIYVDSTPPSKFQAPFQIKNHSNSSIILRPNLIPIETTADGKVNLILSERDNLASIIKDRLVILDGQTRVEELEFQAGETKQLLLFMEVKEADPAGDFYFALVFTSEGTVIDETSTSGIPAGIAMNVLVSVGPKGVASGTIEDFSTRRIIGSGPVLINLKLTNTGRHLIQPEGSVTIKNMLGKKVGDIEILPQYVLSNSSRFLIDSNQASPSAEISRILESNKNGNPVVTWGEKFLLGFYTAEAKIRLEEGGPELTERISFFAIPVQILVTISGIIFVALGILLRINFKLRKKTYTKS